MVSNERNGHQWEFIKKEDDSSLEETKRGFFLMKWHLKRELKINKCYLNKREMSVLSKKHPGWSSSICKSLWQEETEYSSCECEFIWNVQVGWEQLLVVSISFCWCKISTFQRTHGFLYYLDIKSGHVIIMILRQTSV